VERREKNRLVLLNLRLDGTCRRPDHQLSHISSLSPQCPAERDYCDPILQMNSTRLLDCRPRNQDPDLSCLISPCCLGFSLQDHLYQGLGSSYPSAWHPSVQGSTMRRPAKVIRC
jgi:hypothetical protein